MYNAPDPSRVRSATFYYSDAGSLRLPMPLVAARRAYREAGTLPALRPAAPELTDRDWEIAELLSDLFQLGTVGRDLARYEANATTILQRLAAQGVTLATFQGIYNAPSLNAHEVRLAIGYAIVAANPTTTLARRVLAFWGVESMEQLPPLTQSGTQMPPTGGGLQFDTSTIDMGGGAVTWDKKEKTNAWPYVAAGVGVLVVGGAIFLATRKKKRKRRGGRARRRR